MRRTLDQENYTPSRYLELRDEIIVEVGSSGEAREEMHTSALDHVDSSIDMIGDVVEKVVRTIGKSFSDMHTALDVPIEVEKAEANWGSV